MATMKGAMTGLVTLLVVGCASPAAYTFSRPGATQADASEARFACLKEVRELHRYDFCGGWMCIGYRSRQAETQERELKLCMEGKGYTAEEQR